MYDPKLTFLESELNYRNEQLKSGLARNRHRHHRPRRVRRSVEAVDNAQ
jgi:hypothetical protein